MRIEIKKSGGYAGLTETEVTVEDSGLPTEVREAVLGKLAHLFAMPTAEFVGADSFQYEVSISEAGAPRRTLIIGDEKRSVEVRAIVDSLKNSA